RVHEEVEGEVGEHREPHRPGHGPPPAEERRPVERRPQGGGGEGVRPVDVVEGEPRGDGGRDRGALDAREDEGAEEEVEEADAEEEPPRRGLGDAALEGQAGGEVPRVHGPYPAGGDGRRGGRLGARSSHARRGTGPADMTGTKRASPASVIAPKVGGVRRNGKPAAPSERDAPSEPAAPGGASA